MLKEETEHTTQLKMPKTKISDVRDQQFQSIRAQVFPLMIDRSDLRCCWQARQQTKKPTNQEEYKIM